MHKADAFRERRLSGLWRTPAVMAWVMVTAVLIVAGTILTFLSHSVHGPWVFDAADIVNHAAAAGLLATTVILYRSNRSLLRAMDTVVKEGEKPPGPGKPVEMNRRAA
jgi:hypothetical protein